MTFSETSLQGSYIIKLTPFSDERGWFARTYCENEFKAIGHAGEWVQMNHSYTVKKGTIRGMHFQLPPFREIKMVRCIRGKVFDVIVDIRKESQTFLKWMGIELSVAEMNMLYIPAGFAHGFQTLSDDTELIYHHSEFYTPGAEGGIVYNDRALNIKWPLEVTSVSERDLNHPLLDEQFKGI
ncbi:MAG TPA: dTDP-4-dehydrorhamnose 3,5-epimerase [Flavitalea sp.]|nr:dTDP-4-dehydrorhamnose 3,5-epimerase [Flavitalea sp.]